jgi:hypothetical protein
MPACRRSEDRPGEFDLSLYELAQATDIRPLVIETVLTHLELAGIIRPLGSFYAGYQFRLLEPEATPLGETHARAADLSAKALALWQAGHEVDLDRV